MKIVGVAACTVGIAHTYMAQKAIQDECAARGIECKVEAQGGLGIENELTQEDVDCADLVLESVDVGVENEDRFEQKMAEGKFLKVGTSDVIADPVKIIDQAVEIIKATGGAVDASKAEAKAEKKAVSAAPQAPTPASKQSIFADPGKTLLNAFNTGVSYFIPIVVIGGVFLAFSLASGTAGASGMEVTNPLMVSLNTIGMAGISMMIPVLAAYIAYSMAGKPALAPGFVLGYLVNNAVVTPSGNSVSTGFLGAMIMAVICGYFVRWMKTWKVNNTIQTIMPILIIPILTSLVLGMAYIYILATPLGFVMDWLTSVLGSLQGGSAVVLGLVIGVMTAFDMGGPINKTASTFTMAIMAPASTAPTVCSASPSPFPRLLAASLRSSPRTSSMTLTVRWASLRCSWAASVLPRALFPSRSRILATPCPAFASALPWARRLPPSRASTAMFRMVALLSPWPPTTSRCSAWTS